MIVSLENCNSPGPLSAKKSLLQAVREMINKSGKMILFSILKKSINKDTRFNEGESSFVYCKKNEDGLVYFR